MSAMERLEALDPQHHAGYMDDDGWSDSDDADDGAEDDADTMTANIDECPGINVDGYVTCIVRLSDVHSPCSFLRCSFFFTSVAGNLKCSYWSAIVVPLDQSCT